VEILPLSMHHIRILLREYYTLFHTKPKYLFHINNRYYMADLIYNINLGRLSRANVNIAPSTKIKMKANIILPMYTKLISGFDSSPLAGRETLVLYKKSTNEQYISR
jgi:hypothetical protein